MPPKPLMTAAPETSQETSAVLTDTDVGLLDAHWRAANYLAVGQIYLLDNPLLREPLRPEHIKPRLLGRGVARRNLPGGRAVLPARHPAAARAVAAGTHQAAAARALGDDTRAEPDLHPHEPADPDARPQGDLHHRAGPWGARIGGPGLPGRDLQRGLP